MKQAPRVVYDCNVLLQALSSPDGPAGKCVDLALRGQVQLFLCAEIIAELRDVAGRPRVAAKLKITSERAETYITSLELVATLLEGFPRPFTYERDIDDAIYVNLSLAADAKLIVSRDKDLLDLMDLATTVGRDFSVRFPQLRILPPHQFLVELEARKGN